MGRSYIGDQVVKNQPLGQTELKGKELYAWGPDHLSVSKDYVTWSLLGSCLIRQGSKALDVCSQLGENYRCIGGISSSRPSLADDP